jgi:hypothetical protein
MAPDAACALAGSKKKSEKYPKSKKKCGKVKKNEPMWPF